MIPAPPSSGDYIYPPTPSPDYTKAPQIPSTSEEEKGYIPAPPSPGDYIYPPTPSPDYTKAPQIPSTSEEEKEEPIEDSNLLTTIEHTEEEDGEKSDIKKIN